MTETFSIDLMVAMLRKGKTGNQILEILDAIVPQSEMDMEYQEVEVTAV
jgi:hypothetical protein